MPPGIYTYLVHKLEANGPKFLPSPTGSMSKGAYLNLPRKYLTQNMYEYHQNMPSSSKQFITVLYLGYLDLGAGRMLMHHADGSTFMRGTTSWPSFELKA